MTKEQIIASARIFAKLQVVLRKQNIGDVENAMRFPLRAITIYNKQAFARHVLTEETQVFLANEYDAFSVDDYLESFKKPLTIEEQGIWQMAYCRALADQTTERADI